MPGSLPSMGEIFNKGGGWGRGAENSFIPQACPELTLQLQALDWAP